MLPLTKTLLVALTLTAFSAPAFAANDTGAQPKSVPVAPSYQAGNSSADSKGSHKNWGTAPEIVIVAKRPVGAPVLAQNDTQGSTPRATR